MKRLTEEMTRLCQEIGASHRERKDFIRNMKHETARTRKENNYAFQAMAKNGKAERVEFVRGMKKNVAVMRHEFADDITGARRAWYGGNV